MTLQVDLVSPEALLYSGECTQVVARTTDGEIAFLTGHTAFIGVLVPGAVRLWTVEGQKVAIAVGSGFVEVSDDRVTILSDDAELAEHIDPAEARTRAEEARAAASAAPDDEALSIASTYATVRVLVAEGQFD
jgi:F-type H+-transporting ATPase subunit epsilon